MNGITAVRKTAWKTGANRIGSERRMKTGLSLAGASRAEGRGVGRWDYASRIGGGNLGTSEFGPLSQFG